MPSFNQKKIGRLKKVDRFVRLLARKKRIVDYKIKHSEVNSIFIVCFLLIGDTFMYLPALRVVKKNFPNAKISIACSKLVKDILSDQNIVDNFIIVDTPWITTRKKKIADWFRFAQTIFKVNKTGPYDIGIDFRGDWRNIFYMNFVKARRKISYAFTGGEYMLTDVIIARDDLQHFTDEAIHLLESIGCTYKIEEKIPYLSKSNNSVTFQRQFLQDNDLENCCIIGMHPGASLTVKQWAPQKYAELALKLAALPATCRFLIFEGPGEREAVSLIERILNKHNISCLVVKRGLKEYIDIIGVCSIMICNDSGAAHIAAAQQVPEVVIFGNVDPVFVTPKSFAGVAVISHSLECKPCYSNYCKLGTTECIVSVPVNEVFDVAAKLIVELKPKNTDEI